MKTSNKILLRVGAVAVLAACGGMGSKSGNAGFPSADQAMASSWQNMQPGWECRWSTRPAASWWATGRRAKPLPRVATACAWATTIPSVKTAATAMPATRWTRKSCRLARAQASIQKMLSTKQPSAAKVRKMLGVRRLPADQRRN